MQTVSDIKTLLASYGLRPKHRFGQNFLIDQGKLAAIIAAAEIGPGDVVLEVGPGTGTLTLRLLEAGARVLAVEVDRGLEPLLRQVLVPYGDRCTLLIEDVLEGKHQINPRVVEALRTISGAESSKSRLVGSGGESSSHPTLSQVVVGRTDDGRGGRAEDGDNCSPHPTLSQVAAGQTGGGRGGRSGGEDIRGFKLIANLPYNVASPLIANLATDYPDMALGIVMVQREVAERLTAGPGGKDYGPLGVIVQAMCTVERVATLSPGCFWPQPQVDSTVLKLRRRAEPLTDDPRALSALLHRLFSKRRKQLGSILGRATPLPPDIDPAIRPEQLTIAQLIALSRLFPPAAVPKV